MFIYLSIYVYIRRNNNFRSQFNGLSLRTQRSSASYDIIIECAYALLHIHYHHCIQSDSENA
jgi:hypothetical protein